MILPTYRFANSDRTNKQQNGGGARIVFPLQNRPSSLSNTTKKQTPNTLRKDSARQDGFLLL